MESSSPPFLILIDCFDPDDHDVGSLFVDDDEHLRSIVPSIITSSRVLISSHLVKIDSKEKIK